MKRTAALALMMLAACETPVEAPEHFGELNLFLYASFDAEDGSLEAGTPGMEEWLLTLDLEADPVDRAVIPPVLTSEDWGNVTGPSDVDPEVQVPRAIGDLSRHDLDTNLSLLAETNLVCLESESTVWGERTYLSDLDCFLDGSCDTLNTSHEIHKENLLASVWYDQFKDYRRITLEDGREVVWARTWMEQVFYGESGDTSWDQYYALELYLPHADDDTQTWRYIGLWSSITTILTDEAYGAAVVDGMQEALDWNDDFAEGTMCPNDRDAEYDREG